jgi:hypothetical protein
LRSFPMLTEQVKAELLKVSVIHRNSESLGYRGQDSFLTSCFHYVNRPTSSSRFWGPWREAAADL